MLFKPHLAEQIMSGQKTETRRIRFPHVLAVKLHKLDPYLPATGKEWMEWAAMRSMSIHNAIQRANRVLDNNIVELPIQPGRGKPMLGRRPVYRIHYRHLCTITDAGVQAEGVRGAGPWERLRLFIDLWDSINTERSNRWGQNPPVFVIEFEPVERGDDDNGRHED